MWLTNRILVPTDLGESSKAAAAVAVELAKQFRVPLVLLHAHGMPAHNYGSIPFVPTADFLQLLENGARVALDAEADRLKAEDVEVIALLRGGSPWEEILDAAKSLEVGLIVMGTHGRRGLPRALLGSVAEKVVRLSPVPVLTVRSPPGQGGHDS